MSFLRIYEIKYNGMTSFMDFMILVMAFIGQVRIIASFLTGRPLTTVLTYIHLADIIRISKVSQ